MQPTLMQMSHAPNVLPRVGPMAEGDVVGFVKVDGGADIPDDTDRRHGPE